MMKNYFLFFVLIFTSCTKQSELSKEFQCEFSNLNELEVVKDVRNTFSIAIPTNWKTNLYEDSLQSSIFSADTTKQLTETFLIDVSYIKNNILFDDLFKLKVEQENLRENLIQKKTKTLRILEKPSYLVVSKGKKSSFLYQKLQAYIKIDQQHFILAKAEVYGDSLSEYRLCKAITLIQKIKINP